MGVITLYSSRSFIINGRAEKLYDLEVNPSVTKTWGNVQQIIADKGIDISGMKAIISETKTTLESPEAVLPWGQVVGGRTIEKFTIMFSPSKVSSGISEEEADEMHDTADQFIADYQALVHKVADLEERVSALETGSPEKAARIKELEAEERRINQI